jgi:hypothetical protein
MIKAWIKLIFKIIKWNSKILKWINKIKIKIIKEILSKNLEF